MLPIPTFLLAVFLAFIPLQDPQAGWKANTGAWIRFALAALLTGLGLIVQTNAMVPASRLNVSRILLLAAVMTAFLMLMSCYVASVWVYPIPFGYIIFVPPYACGLIVLFNLAIGKAAFRQHPTLKDQLHQHLGIILIQASLCCIYPAFSAIYFRLESTEQATLLLLLPCIKLIMQSATSSLARDTEECIPGIIVFSVEVFNALYMSKCMQNSKSNATYFVIMGFDTIKSILTYRDMKQQLSELSHTKIRYNSGNSTSNLLESVLRVCKEPGVIHQNLNTSIRIKSCVQLRTFAAYGELYEQPPHSTQSTLSAIETNNLRRLFTTTNSLSLAEKHEFVYRTLKILFQCEYHMLAEYVECVIPTIYAVYLAILSCLPSMKYYPEIRGMTPAQVATMALNVLMYAGLEVLSLVILHFALKRKLGFSPYILAFVLENHFVEIQARLLVWFSFLLQMTLVHYGTSGQLCSRLL